MKKTFFAILCVSLAAVSCSREQETVQSGRHVITINSDEVSTKTSLDGDKTSGFTASWTAGDKIKVFRTTQTGMVNAESAPLAEDCQKAAFTVELEESEGPESYTAVYPASAVKDESGIWGIEIPKTQTSTSGNWDKDADLLIAGPAVCAETPESLSLPFCRLGSVVRVEVEGMEDETIDSIRIVSDGTRLAGRYSFNPTTGEAEIRTECENAVTVLCPGETVACARVFTGLHTGVSFFVHTDKHVYTKATSGEVIFKDNTVNCFHLTVDPGSTMKGSGVENDPYQIETAAHLKAVASRLVLDTPTYFKLMNDLDLSGVDNWLPLNPTANNMRIDFDGDGHTISNMSSSNTKYASLFGLIAGSVRNLNFDKCSAVSNVGGLAGIITGWAGIMNNSFTAEIINCHVTNSSVSNVSSSSAIILGGICARCGNATLKNVSFQGTVTNSSTALESFTGGIAGQCYGTNKFENVSFDGTVSSTASRYVGGLIGQGVVNSGAISLTVDGASVKGTVTCAYDNCGGIIANTSGGTYNNCKVEADINVGKNASSNYSYCGGIIGVSNGSALNPSVTNCSYKGTITAKSNVVGGLIGQVSKDGKTTTVSDCTVEGTLTGVEFLAAGLAYNQYGNLVMTNVNSSMKVTGTSNEIAGMVAYTANSSTSKITNCHQTGDLTGVSFCGGIMGRVLNHTTTISRCHFSGKINGTNKIGGIVGASNKAGTTHIFYIDNCYSTGSISASDGYAGGIAGEAAQKCTIKNCYSTCTISGGYSFGGILARASNISNTGKNMAQNFGNEVSGCIAWNPSITTTKSAGVDPLTSYSGGATVGFSVTLNTLKNCWYRPDMTMKYYTIGTLDTLFDHEDVSSTAPLTEPYSYTYFWPYHGKAATAGETISDVAKRIGWSTTIWDLTGDEPKLK